MFTAERSSVFLNEERNLSSEIVINIHISRILQIQEGTQVKLTCCNMGIICTVKVVFLKNLFKFSDIIREEFRKHCSILNDLDTSFLSRDYEQYAQPCFSQVPNF